MTLKVSQTGATDAQAVIKWAKSERKKLQPQLDAREQELLKLPKERLVYYLKQTSDCLDGTLVALIKSMELFS